MEKQSGLMAQERDSQSVFSALIRSTNSPIFTITDNLTIRDKVNLFSVNKSMSSHLNQPKVRNILWKLTLSFVPNSSREIVLCYPSRRFKGFRRKPTDDMDKLKKCLGTYLFYGKTSESKEIIRDLFFLNDKVHLSGGDIPEYLIEKSEGIVIRSPSCPNLCCGKGYTLFGVLSLLGYVKLLEIYVRQIRLEADSLNRLIFNDKYSCFSNGIIMGDMAILHKLWSWTDDNYKPTLLTNGLRFCDFAASKGYLDVLQQFRRWANQYNIWDELYLKQGCQLFNDACSDGQDKVVRQLWKWSGTDEDRKYKLSSGFKNASENGQLEILQLLWEWAEDYHGLRESLLVDSNCEAFIVSAKDSAYSNIQVVQQLWIWAGNFEGLRSTLLSAQNFQVFIQAVQLGRATIMRELWKYIGENDNMKDKIVKRITYYFTQEKIDKWWLYDKCRVQRALKLVKDLQVECLEEETMSSMCVIC